MFYTLFIILICLAMMLVIGFSHAFSIFYNAPWVPLRRKTIDGMLKMAEIKPGEIVMDLGSGDGRVLLRAVRDYRAQGRGVELNPLLSLFSRAEVRARGLSQDIIIKRENMFRADISRADVVTMYLFPEANRALENKLMCELKPGARVVSYAFDFVNWRPVRQVRCGAGNIYLYIKDW